MRTTPLQFTSICSLTRHHDRSLEDVLIPDAQYASAFSPITPDPPPSRAGKKKVRFDVEEPPTEPEPNGAAFGS